MNNSLILLEHVHNPLDQLNFNLLIKKLHFFSNIDTPCEPFIEFFFFLNLAYLCFFFNDILF